MRPNSGRRNKTHRTKTYINIVGCCCYVDSATAVHADLVTDLLTYWPKKTGRATLVSRKIYTRCELSTAFDSWIRTGPNSCLVCDLSHELKAAESLNMVYSIYMTSESSPHFYVSRSKVKVTRSACSAVTISTLAYRLHDMAISNVVMISIHQLVVVRKRTATKHKYKQSKKQQRNKQWQTVLNSSVSEVRSGT